MNNPHLKARVLLKLPTTPFRDNFRVADNPDGIRFCERNSVVVWQTQFRPAEELGFQIPESLVETFFQDKQ